MKAATCVSVAASTMWHDCHGLVRRAAVQSSIDFVRRAALALTEYQLHGMQRLVGMEIVLVTPRAQHESKTKLLDAALHVIRSKGYAATTVDAICREVCVTKGSFFHHFKSKDELALDAAAHREL